MVSPFRRSGRAVSVAAMLLLCGCSREARDIGPSIPQTPPRGATDPRIRFYQDNVYQIAQGGRYFTWYGCTACHAGDAPGVRDLTDRQWRRGGTFDRVYASIAHGHGRHRYAARIPIEQLWQITAHVRDLPRHTPEKRRRLAVDQVGEPRGADWPGPVR